MDDAFRTTDEEQRAAVNALDRRLTRERLRELVSFLNPIANKPGKPETMLKNAFRGWADIGYRKARWKDDQEEALEQIESRSRSLKLALVRLVPPYRTAKIASLIADLESLAAESRAQIKAGSRLDTRPWADAQILEFLQVFLWWSENEPAKGPNGNCYRFLFECMKTMTGKYPQEDGRGGLRGAYSRLLPHALYIRDHRFDFLGG